MQALKVLVVSLCCGVLWTLAGLAWLGVEQIWVGEWEERARHGREHRSDTGNQTYMEFDSISSRWLARLMTE
ncbi:hypothetical protein [Chitiniphilus eburneus]|uniref:Uncharacterized protein n=1 Tax=Chitiniphilus eburneus TaxID=2571148 RepID=A0A4U0PGC0_9NEIS|nr:hypothetical protein [Chitiniphilus eburneus]TJZ66819.1 hypothetical protein FAZ21_16675 [Chitiniphilus eburneus]